jgi:hypothetical protein
MREIRPSGSVRGVRRKPYPYRDIVHPVQSTAYFLPVVTAPDGSLRRSKAASEETASATQNGRLKDHCGASIS